MRVSLLENINALGPKGATVDVPDGYAINFLFPQYLAVKVANSVATDKDEAARLKVMKKEPISPQQELAGQLDGLEVVITVPVKKGKLSAPVTATEVRASLKDMGYSVPKSAIKMSPIIALGTQDVHILFETGFEATITVVVESGV
ncbi:MAG: 50S ribosomal protein L9 [Patescibacteria group bacterium]